MNGNENARPYPSIDGTTCNCRLACELARQHSAELNAVSEYIYQSIVFAGTMPQLSDMFDGIALDEMHHFRMLGELIRLLGGDPAVRTAVRNRGGICLPCAGRRRKGAAVQYRRRACVIQRVYAARIACRAHGAASRRGAAAPYRRGRKGAPPHSGGAPRVTGTTAPLSRRRAIFPFRSRKDTAALRPHTDRAPRRQSRRESILL